MAAASLPSPIITSQRGLCGMRLMPIARITAGVTPTMIIARQSCDAENPAPTR